MRTALTAAAAIALVAVGVAIGAGLWRTPSPQSVEAPAANASRPAAVPHRAASGSAITLPPEMVQRAGIRTTAVAVGSSGARLRIPGVVEPNRYRQVAVTSLVPGRVTQVRAELGQRVARGQVLATLYSPDFADAQTEFVGLHAEVAAHGQQLVRTQRLAAIGAASRKDLEDSEAQHARGEAALAAARSRLALLGMSEQRMDALATDHKVTTTVDITAPMNGVISERGANVGMSVDLATPLFTVVDLSTVWIIGDVYERDFAAVGVGSPATVRTAAYPDLALEGKVSYIDPTVQSATRTAKVRVEVANPGGQLRLGMYVDVDVEVQGAAAATALLVPRSAVQTIGDTRIVYVANPQRQGEFSERRVEVAELPGDHLRVVSGLAAGEHVVSAGAFYLRAERQRTAAPDTAPPPGAGHQGH